jgi:hypothetical protein
MKTTSRRVSPVIIRRVTLGLRNLHKTVGIAIISLFAALMVGCGLHLNTSATSEGSPTTGGSGGPVATGQIIPVPATFQPLTGCTNPNTGVSNGDWGTGSNPVFVNPWDVVEQLPSTLLIRSFGQLAKPHPDNPFY